MTTRYNTYHEDRKITAPAPPKDKRGGGFSPSVSFKNLSRIKKGK